MKQRLAIAAALLGNPEVLILDEPTNGLDPQGIAEIRELIIDVGKRGITIILASHILDEVQKICSHVAVLDKGKKLFAGRVSEVLSRSSRVEVSADNMGNLKLALAGCPMVSSHQEEGGVFIVQLKDEFRPVDLNKWLFDKGITAGHLAMQRQSLEKYFLELLNNS
jgi:ABC-2 type transport system ATP-binding protein